MTNTSLAQSYLVKARHRLKVLDMLLADGAFSDVVREAQEVMELSLKGMLREVGVEPPKWHDVGQLLEEHRDRLPAPVLSDLPLLIAASAWLRKEREFSFYGDIDFIPTERYTRDDAERAISAAQTAVKTAGAVIRIP
jgi:HEPN domain-containing protein